MLTREATNTRKDSLQGRKRGREDGRGSQISKEDEEGKKREGKAASQLHRIGWLLLDTPYRAVSLSSPSFLNVMEQCKASQAAL